MVVEERGADGAHVEAWRGVFYFCDGGDVVGELRFVRMLCLGRKR